MTCSRGPESRRNRSLCRRRIGVRVGSASEYPQVRDTWIGRRSANCDQCEQGRTRKHDGLSRCAGIAEDADDETLASSFRALARRYHPDVGAGYSPGEFQRAREAHETLVDPERRRRYDLQLRRARAVPVVVRHVVISRPFAEPLLGSRHTHVLRCSHRLGGGDAAVILRRVGGGHFRVVR